MLWKNMNKKFGFPTTWKPGRTVSFWKLCVLFSYCCCNKVPHTNNICLVYYPPGSHWAKMKVLAGLYSFLEAGHLYPSFPASMATHSSILAWRIPWMEEPGRLQSTGLTKSWTRLHFHFPASKGHLDSLVHGLFFPHQSQPRCTRLTLPPWSHLPLPVTLAGKGFVKDSCDQGGLIQVIQAQPPYQSP